MCNSVQMFSKGTICFAKAERCVPANPVRQSIIFYFPFKNPIRSADALLSRCWYAYWVFGGPQASIACLKSVCLWNTLTPASCCIQRSRKKVIFSLSNSGKDKCCHVGCRTNFSVTFVGRFLPLSLTKLHIWTTNSVNLMTVWQCVCEWLWWHMDTALESLANVAEVSLAIVNITRDVFTPNEG